MAVGQCLEAAVAVSAALAGTEASDPARRAGPMRRHHDPHSQVTANRDTTATKLNNKLDLA